MSAVRLSISQPYPERVREKKTWSELEEIIAGLSLGWTIAEFTAEVSGGD